MQVQLAKKKSLTQRLTPESRGIFICEIYFTLYLISSFAYAALCPPDKFAYDLSLLRAVLIAAGAAISLWMLHQRRHAARVWCLGTVALCAALSAIDVLGLGAIADASAIVGMPLALSATAIEWFGAGFVSYALIFDDNVSSQLTRHTVWEPAHKEGHSWDEPWRTRIRSWEFWRDITIYFIVFSFLGHWAEMLFCRLIVLGVFMGGYDPTNAMLWDQWLFPFSAEGTALACVVLILHPVKLWLMRVLHNDKKKAIGLSFLLNMAVCTSIDFGTGMVANQHYELWDYRDMPFNFMGQVCLQNSLVYSIAATLIVWVVYPAMDTGLRRLPKDVADGLFWGLVGTYGFLSLLHFMGQ